MCLNQDIGPVVFHNDDLDRSLNGCSVHQQFLRFHVGLYFAGNKLNTSCMTKLIYTLPEPAETYQHHAGASPQTGLNPAEHLWDVIQRRHNEMQQRPTAAVLFNWMQPSWGYGPGSQWHLSTAVYDQCPVYWLACPNSSHFVFAPGEYTSKKYSTYCGDWACTETVFPMSLVKVGHIFHKKFLISYFDATLLLWFITQYTWVTC